MKFSGKNVEEKIRQAALQAQAAVARLATEESVQFIAAAAERIIACYRRQNKLLIAGNGGSLCDAMHFAEEMTGFFRRKRPALAALAPGDPGHLTCVGNDVGFEEVFSRFVEAHGKEGDILIVLTTSGQSENLVRAVDMAKRKQVETVAFLGKTGGKLRGMCNLEWIIDGFPFSDRIQEAHMAAIHILIEQVEEALFFQQEPNKAMAEAL